MSESYYRICQVDAAVLSGHGPTRVSVSGNGELCLHGHIQQSKADHFSMLYGSSVRGVPHGGAKSRVTVRTYKAMNLIEIELYWYAFTTGNR